MLIVNHVWHHRTRKLPFSSFNVNEKLAFSKIFTLESVFEKMSFRWFFFTGYVRMVGETRDKKPPFSNKNGYVWTGHKTLSTRIRIFLKTDIFSPLSKNTLPHVAYLNNFRTSTRKRLNNETFCYPVWHEQQRPGTGASHGFTHIENRAGAVGRDGLVH